ncbi:hypothetical protein EHEL_010550 [Encephalitozoon hellem ATCC 50504]|uniref:Uncharacterized protein n=1 Tax=Encephalitozoon hellem TaxID=27973 RepID=A0A9Q9FAM1_ENCHE|nr:uncharacterized protein EHEL_010550 [Encephalitozoon hellem ATCC 50504]AFM97679.1 hypothetical protein EHEL_010550 [Encephalitozoon hellem ATCC 50504]UTX42370.1 hypothetical protein GPU96_01g00720 [Encephalitozoon hellem]|eukprot:XP_003886660.1 hypothetical protein EHEL_010550 [Encephalitozoon hellem ATCC 50504]
MFESTDDIRLSDILFGSDVDAHHCSKTSKKKEEEKNMWKKNVKHYKILSVDQISALEDFFISKQVPVTKTNIKHASKALKIPYQRSVNYLYNKYKKVQDNAEDFYHRCIHEFSLIMQNVERCWELYLKGCQAYNTSRDSKN